MTIGRVGVWVCSPKKLKKNKINQRQSKKPPSLRLHGLKINRRQSKKLPSLRLHGLKINRRQSKKLPSLRLHGLKINRRQSKKLPSLRLHGLINIILLNYFIILLIILFKKKKFTVMITLHFIYNHSTNMNYFIYTSHYIISYKFHVNMVKCTQATNMTQIKHINKLRIPTGGRLTSWLFTQHGGVEFGTTEDISI